MSDWPHLLRTNSKTIFLFDATHSNGEDFYYTAYIYRSLSTTLNSICDILAEMVFTKNPDEKLL